ncbi:hypothetical protein C3747_14g69 [Trypanosoma cruzi]|uniref:Uncharacterized protein n=2 Tax=Trypanosoma cruzi TaxID=5693 RepID=Q4E615_TRYCC|nr:hypothetical protein Tc00.1047053508153.780 [Trypanosoma cruzi]EAO00266.1 hypothetical protein Tc00.1047053508153.780 [Trypanosoma cruzi]PWV18192.1 hypothetical protein C3747_14g69 [Trypanosoma cruzi]RNC48884.1 hypothetical protein TcCL_NonESM01159 [Trypanosoma cruzi]|eukprot:XP_822117.1 hypothetical protein [Trypanosoma cruzi strain CL Brener]
MIQTESEQPLISRANEGGRFPCCITLEDISVDVCTNFTSALSSCVETPCWDEMRVVFFRDGVTQTTRWLSPAVAMHQMMSASAKRIGIDKGSSERLPGITEVKWSPINAAAYTVYFRFLDKDADHSLDPGYERPVFSTNLKYLDSYNTDDADRLRSKVSPKVIHPFYFSIECRNPNRAFVYTGGEGERPTSAKVEAMSAYYSRCVSKISTVFRKASIKLSSGSTEGSRSVEGEAADRPQTKGHGHCSNYSSSFYVCDKYGVDPSEAYNAPGGRRCISLPLIPSHSKLPQNKTGVPLTLHLTMVAHLNDPLMRPVRDYHSMVVLVDQVILDVMNVEAETGGKDASSARRVEAYGFGLTSNTSQTAELRFSSPFLAPPDIPLNQEGGVRLVDFSVLHPSQNERELTALDLAKNPTSICIVSSGCKVGNKRRIGNRPVLVSRFKTGVDGLCKSSYKSRLVMGLIRRYNTGEVEVERCSHPVDLASILNQEEYSDKIGAMIFSRGEYMSFRLRRRCFAEPERYRTELLMPYDYDNSGVEISDVVDDDDIVMFSAQGARILPEENASKSGGGDDVPNGDGGRPDESRMTPQAATPTGTTGQLVEKPMPSVTDSVMTSYSHEYQSYVPAQKNEKEAATGSSNRFIIGKPQRDGDSPVVKTSRDIHAEDSESLRGKGNAEGAESNADGRVSSRDVSLLRETGMAVETGQTNPFEKTTSNFLFDSDAPKEGAAHESLSLVTFELNAMGGINGNDDTQFALQVEPYISETIDAPRATENPRVYWWES